MREAEMAERMSRSTESKQLNHKHLAAIYVLIALMFLVTIYTKNKTLLFIFVTAFSALINYQTNITTIRFNPAPEVISGLLLTRVIGFPAAVLMITVPTLFIDIYTARLDQDTFVSLVLTIAVSYLMSIIAYDFVILGVILVTVKFVLGLIINLLIEVSLQEIVFEHVLGYISNVIILLAAGNYLIMMFS